MHFYCNCHSYEGLVKQKHLLKIMLRNKCSNVLPFIPALTMIHMHEVTVYTTNAHYIRILSVDLTGLLDSRNICTLYRVEMQQYIDILPYRDTLSGDAVSIHITLYRYIEYRDISMYCSVSTFRLYTYTYSIL